MSDAIFGLARGEEAGWVEWLHNDLKSTQEEDAEFSAAWDISVRIGELERKRDEYDQSDARTPSDIKLRDEELTRIGNELAELHAKLEAMGEVRRADPLAPPTFDPEDALVRMLAAGVKRDLAEEAVRAIQLRIQRRTTKEIADEMHITTKTIERRYQAARAAGVFVPPPHNALK